MPAAAPAPPWPSLPYAPWQQTCQALHLWTQIVGKYRLAHTPWMNHSWHATLYVTPHGLTTGVIPDGERSVVVAFDFSEHRLSVRADGGASATMALRAMSVAQFWGQFGELVSAVGGRPSMHARPNELPDPVPFAQDTTPRPYDAEAVERWHQALRVISPVFERFSTGFLGKKSPVHLFWGAFDLAVTRFSGARASSPHPGGIPNLPDTVTREAYSHEVSSAGFWPGGFGAEEAMFYSYAFPTPEGFKSQPVQPAQATYHDGLGEFVLPYEAVRTAQDPGGTLLDFLQSTYQAAATLAHWDRDALECTWGRPGVPRRT